jgi:catechol 2,3-dioxygenase-like lactoylglutathione lyase family enzyme
MNRQALHICLNVADLDASVAFYGALFAHPAAKHQADYAKFELEQPALVLSLIPGAADARKPRLNHLGLRVETDEALAALEERLRGAGVDLRVQGETVCCYARAIKLWVEDPDGNPWELYRFLEDTPQADSAANGGCCVGSCEA